jgi:hypothetical protein
MRKPHFFLTYLVLFGFLLNFTLSSCAQDDLIANILEDSVAEAPAPAPTNPGEPTAPTDPNAAKPGDLVINATPCDYTLDNVAANATLDIECRLDLGGKTVDLPNGVTLNFKGGEIINGTLNFGAAGKIDGDLLNHKLQLSGTVTLLSDVFQYRTKRWEIVEGKVSDAVARKNRDLIEAYFANTLKLGANTFQTDNFDAFFKTDGPLGEAVPELHAINLPSNFHLAMSNNTHIRMQPNGHFRPTLLAIHNATNVKVTGGTIHGEREEHNYNSNYVDTGGATGNTHEWVTNMAIKGGSNITVDGVVFMDPAGDCLSINSIYHYFDPRHIRSKNITLTNNKFIRARRTNLVITNAEQVFIENNEFIDGGIDMNKSKGIAPSSNFNIEPHRTRNSDTGELIEYERVSDIYLRNNKQIVNDKVANPSAGSFQLSHGNGPIVVEDNEMINTGISFTTVDGVIIRNNKISGIGAGITAGDAGNINRTDFVFGNEVYGNEVNNSTGTAINISGNGNLIRDNVLIGVSGISIGPGATDPNMGTSNSIITNNIVKVRSRGIVAMNTSKNVIIENNTIEMLAGSTFSFTINNKWNEAGDANFVIKNNIVKGNLIGSKNGAPAGLFGANSLTVLNNEMGPIQINGGSNMVFKDNIIDTNKGESGMLFFTDCPVSSFTNNEMCRIKEWGNLV